VLSALVGLVIALGLVFGSIFVGGSPLCFILFPALIIVIGIALGLRLVSCGACDLARALSCLCLLISKPTDSSSLRRSAQVQRYLISYLYAGGILGALIGFIQMAHNLPDMDQLLPSMAINAPTLFYAVFLSECVVRPVVHKIESATKAEN